MMNDWSNSPGTGMPASNPIGQELGVDNIQLHRTSPQPVDVMTAFNRALEILKANPGEAIGYPLAIMFGAGMISGVAQVIMQIFSMVIFGIAGALGQANETLAMIVSIGASLVFFALLMALMFVIQGLAAGAMNIFWLRLVRGQQVDFSHLKALKSAAIPLILGMLLNGFGVMGGVILLVIPGYILMFGWMFWSLVIIDKNLGAVDALKASWRLTNGHKLNLFLLMLLLGLVNMVGMLACGVGMLVTAPLTLGAMVCYYDAVAQPGNAYLTEGEGIQDVFS